MAGLVIYYVISVAFLKLNIIQELTVALNDAVKNSQDMLTAMGKEDQIELLKKQNADFIKMVGTLVPYF